MVAAQTLADGNGAVHRRIAPHRRSPIGCALVRSGVAKGPRIAVPGPNAFCPVGKVPKRAMCERLAQKG